MKDLESAELKEKSNVRFSDFIFRIMVIFVLNSPQFLMNVHEN